MLNILCESSAWQKIHMKNQVLFSLKDKSKNNKSVVCCNFAWRFLRVNANPSIQLFCSYQSATLFMYIHERMQFTEISSLQNEHFEFWSLTIHKHCPSFKVAVKH